MSRIPIAIADGAMASELERLGFDMPHGTPNLWSSAALVSNIDLVRNVHASYLVSGATVFSTCTYQLTLEASRNEETGRDLFRRAVNVLNDTITSMERGGYKRLLSLGPCAVVQPSGTEYTGEYTSPFLHDGQPSVDAMCEFHLSRMELVPEEDWSKLDGVLFETVPLLSEVVAIRKAVQTFRHRHQAVQKELYISMVFPNGHLPGWQLDMVSDRTTSDEGIAFAKTASTSSEGQANIDGIGINCTHPRFLGELVSALNSAIGDKALCGATAPTLLLYADGGALWDDGKFINRLDEGDWCNHVKGALDCALRGNWGRIWLGGCCNTSPLHIRMLHETVSEIFRL